MSFIVVLVYFVQRDYCNWNGHYRNYKKKIENDNKRFLKNNLIKGHSNIQLNFGQRVTSQLYKQMQFTKNE